MRFPEGLFVAFALSVLPSARAADGAWPRFRGPDGAGLSEAKTIPVTWTEKDFDWRVKLPGEGHGSPAVVAGRIFVLCSDRSDATRILACLDAGDGKIAWQRRFASKTHRINRDNSYAASTPAADEERVYVTWTAPEEVTLLALDHGGKEVWRRDLGSHKSEHGSGTSPIVFEDFVVLANDQLEKSFLIAVDRKTGETRWQIERKVESVSYSTPCVFRPEGGPPELIFTSTAHGVTSIDPRTGALNWEFAGAFPLRVVGSPAVAGGLIVGSCGTGGVGKRFVAVRPGSRKDLREPRLAYDLRKDIPYVPTPLGTGDLLFLLTDRGLARCLRPATGEEVWRKPLDARFYGSFICIDGKLYAMSRDGDAFVLAASETFELLGKNPIGEGSHATPAVAGGILYLRTYNHLISIGGRKPAP
ncbi:MAG: PQQ-binding-like beta-propeller repeat protein [Planctomycetes bacterium]|nr:PQQ-binding-like beta-propeller repeat protein [Planctomycetota bacterium]